MKKIIILLLTTIMVVSCDQSKTTYDALSFPNDAFVSFAQSTGDALESSTAPIDVTLTLANSPAGTASPTSVSFTISSDNAIEGTHYTVVDNRTSFEFAPGVYKDKIQIMPIDNLIQDGDKVLTITLGSSTSSINLGFPGPDGLGKNMVVTITDDDCAKDSTLSPLEGTWTGTDSCGDYTNQTLTTTLPCLVDGAGILISGVGYSWLQDPTYWGEIVVNQFPTYMTVDLAAGTVDIADQPYVTTDYNGFVSDYNIVGTGTINMSGASPVITISYDMTHATYGSMANDYGGSSCVGLFQATYTLN